MKSTFLLLVIAVTVASARRGRWSPEERACFKVMKPDDVFENMKANMETCIAEQDGLQAIIDGLRAEAGERDGERGRSGRFRSGRGGRHRGGTYDLLEENGHGDAALALRTCIARLHGHVNSDDTFNVAGFQDNVRTRVAGTEQEANVLLGLENCPTDALANFKIHDYMKCVQAYCATGEPPAAE